MNFFANISTYLEKKRLVITGKAFVNFIFLISLIFSSYVLFTSNFADAAWYSNGWAFRKKIVIDKDKVGGSLTNYVMLFNETNIDFRSLANGGKVYKSNGGDILFTSADGSTKLSHEIETYNAVTGQITAWINIPSINNSVNTEIYIYFGNASATDQWATNGAVWSSDYKLVYHMNDSTTSSLSNATQYNLPGTKVPGANEPVEYSAKVSRGQFLDGINDRLLVTNSNLVNSEISNTPNNLTIEAWLNPSSYPNVAPRLLDKEKYLITMDTTGKIIFRLSLSNTIRNVIQTNTITLNSWSHIVATFDSSLGSNQMKLYINGVLNNQATYTGTIDNSSGFYLYIGDFYSGNASRLFHGGIDEFRVSTATKTPAWITTTYNNQNSPSTFYTMEGTECDGVLCYPSEPLNLNGLAQSEQVSLTWDAPTYAGKSAINDYIIEYKESTASSYTQFNDGVSVNTNSVVTNLVNGRSYDFRVYATNSDGSGLYSSVITRIPISGTPEPPIAYDLQITGNEAVNQIITGSYSYLDPNNDLEGISTFRWLKSDTEFGVYSPINGENETSYRILEADYNKYLKFEVTPRSVNEPVNGDAVISLPVLIDENWNFMNQILSTGQSLSLGSQGTPPLTTSQPYQNKMIVSNAFVPLVEGPNETISSSMANTITNLSETNYEQVVSRHGQSGTNYLGLKKGTTPYNNGLAQVTSAKNISESLQRTLNVNAITIIHGEADAARTKATYKGYLEEWYADYNSDVKAITNQENNIPIFTDQMGSYTKLGYQNSGVPLAQLEASEENPGEIYLIGPKYFLQYAPDGVHLTNTSYRHLGEYYGKAMYQTLIENDPWKPLSPETIVRSGDKIHVKFYVPAPPIQIDTTNVLENTDYGFVFHDDSGDTPDITNVQVIGPDTIELTLESVPTGNNQRVSYAFNGTIGANAGADQNGSARGNIRDSDSTVSLYGNNLYNWLVQFEKPVTADTTPPTNLVVTANVDNPTNVANPEITFSAIDNIQIDRFEVKINSGSFNQSSSPLTLNGLTEGQNIIYVRAYDGENNYIEDSVNIVLDQTPPDQFEIISDLSKLNSENTVKITFNTTDTNGINFYLVSINGGNFVQSLSPVNLIGTLNIGNNIILVRAYDNAGNYKESTKAITIQSNQLSTTPTIIVNSNPTNSPTPTNLISSGPTAVAASIPTTTKLPSYITPSDANWIYIDTLNNNDNVSLKEGDKNIFTGSAEPNSEVQIKVIVNSETKEFNVRTNENGKWEWAFPDEVESSKEYKFTFAYEKNDLQTIKTLNVNNTISEKPENPNQQFKIEDYILPIAIFLSVGVISILYFFRKRIFKRL